jgi:RNA polymerase sigma factor (sigma-70 family)
MDSNRDHEILEAYLRRPNRRRLGQVVRALHQYVWGVALKVAGNREDAADVCQEFFLSLLLRPPTHGSIHSARGYVACRVTTISRSMRRAARRRQAREQKAAANCLGVENLSAEDSASLLEALETLPERLQTVVELSYFGRLPQHEVAKILDVSPRTVAGDLDKAKALLRDRLVGPAALVTLLTEEPARAEPPPELLRDLLRIADLGWALSLETAKVAAGATTKKVLTAAMAALFLFALILWIAPQLRAPRLARSTATPGGRSSAPAEPLVTVIAAPPVEKQAPPPPAEPAATPEEIVPPENPYGSLIVRVIWEASGLPAEGICIRAIPWSSPDVYLDDVEGVTNAAGIFRVERVFRGVGTVYLDRGGSEYFRVQPGTESGVLLKVPPGINVRGFVVNSENAPVAGAKVWMSYGGNIGVGREVAATAADGAFEVLAVGKGTYLGARAPGYAPSSLRLIQGDVGATADIKVVLSESGGALRGVVLDPEGQPVSRAVVMVGFEYPRPRILDDGILGRSAAAHFLRTDDSGQFFASTISSGETEITVRAPGFAPFAAKVDVPPGGGGPPLTVVLERGGTISGTVRDDEGNIAPARISVGDWGRVNSVKVATGPSGCFKLRGVPPGRILIHANGHKDGALKGRAAAWLEVKSGVELRWDPVLSRNLEIAGRVVDAREAALAGWTVQAEELVGDVPRLFTAVKATTGADGSFTIDDLSGLDYLLSVSEPGSKYPSLWIDPTVPGSEERLIRVPDEARATGFVAGVVLDTDGEPCREALVSMFQSNSRSAYDFDAYNSFHLASQETGGFKVGPLPAGLYRLEVQGKGRKPLVLEEREILANSILDLGTLRLVSR